MKSKYDDIFEGIERALNIPVGETTRQISNKSTPKGIKMNIEKSTIDELKSYVAHYETVSTSMHRSIESLEAVMEKLELDIKIGTEPRIYEVYGQLSDTHTRKLTELAKLDEMAQKIKNELAKRQLEVMKFKETKSLNAAKKLQLENKSTGVSSTNGAISLTPKQIMDMMNEAKKASSMSSIDADFTVCDDDLK